MNSYFQFEMIDVVLQSEKHKNTKVEFINEHRETFMIDNNKITGQGLGGDLKVWGRKEGHFYRIGNCIILNRSKRDTDRWMCILEVTSKCADLPFGLVLNLGNALSVLEDSDLGRPIYLATKSMVFFFETYWTLFWLLHLLNEIQWEMLISLLWNLLITILQKTPGPRGKPRMVVKYMPTWSKSALDQEPIA